MTRSLNFSPGLSVVAISIPLPPQTVSTGLRAQFSAGKADSIDNLQSLRLKILFSTLMHTLFFFQYTIIG